MCFGGGQRWALSLWLVENSTGPEEQRRLWHSASEPKTERGWRLIMLPLYGLVDWYGESSCSIDRLKSDLANHGLWKNRVQYMNM